MKVPCRFFPPVIEGSLKRGIDAGRTLSNSDEEEVCCHKAGTVPEN